MSRGCETPCARTDAVLALHLDGDGDLATDARQGSCAEGYDQLDPSPEERDRIGYGFVSVDALHEHLRSCSSCQQALARARRLDAMLASDAGRTIATVAGGDDDKTAWQDRMLRRAQVAWTALSEDEPELVTSDAGGAGNAPASWLTTSWLSTGFAIASVLFAGVATWWCLWAIPGSQDTSPPANAAPYAEVPTVDGIAIDATPAAPADEFVSLTLDTELPLAMVANLRQHNERELPDQRTIAPTELGARIADRQSGAAARIAAVQQLGRRARSRSVAGRLAFDQLLLSLAACGDRGNSERMLHEELLERVRSERVLLQNLQVRVTALASCRQELDLDHLASAACVVATRLGDNRLDLALRRALRRHDAIAQIVASSLRCGVRGDDAADLLLDCWQEQITLGRQRDTLAAATFWFTGQPAATFQGVGRRLHGSRFTTERVRCLYALGCAADGATVETLMERLHAPHRTEAAAAAIALAKLPHSVLAELLPRAKRTGNGWLRASLARSELPAARKWLRTIGLSPKQRSLLRTADLAHFPEVATWFRNHPLLAD